jgi:hypothetical protein
MVGAGQATVESYSGPPSTATEPRLCGTATVTVPAHVPPLPSVAENAMW